MSSAYSVSLDCVHYLSDWSTLGRWARWSSDDVIASPLFLSPSEHLSCRRMNIQDFLIKLYLLITVFLVNCCIFAQDTLLIIIRISWLLYCYVWYAFPLEYAFLWVTILLRAQFCGNLPDAGKLVERHLVDQLGTVLWRTQTFDTWLLDFPPTHPSLPHYPFPLPSQLSIFLPFLLLLSSPWLTGFLYVEGFYVKIFTML